MQVTQWFSGWQLPVHEGIYQRLYPIYRTNVIEYCYWDGRCWYADVYPDAKCKSLYQSLQWRGVAR